MAAIRFDYTTHQAAHGLAAALVEAGLRMPGLDEADEETLVRRLGLTTRADPSAGEALMRVEPSDACLETVAAMCIAYRDQRRAWEGG